MTHVPVNASYSRNQSGIVIKHEDNIFLQYFTNAKGKQCIGSIETIAYMKTDRIIARKGNFDNTKRTNNMDSSANCDSIFFRLMSLLRAVSVRG